MVMTVIDVNFIVLYWRSRSTQQQILRSIARGVQRVAVALVPEHELAFIVGAAQKIRERPLRPSPHGVKVLACSTVHATRYRLSIR